jgi:1,2-phenylacetyl-CoA epoxidase PaaB subunit
VTEAGRRSEFFGRDRVPARPVKVGHDQAGDNRQARWRAQEAFVRRAEQPLFRRWVDDDEHAIAVSAVVRLHE